MNIEVRSKRKNKMNEEETEAVASNKAVRSKKKKKMNKAVVVTTSNKVKNYLCHDIIIFILSKLPLKLLKRFECVCKLWATIFQSSYFKTLYFNNLMSNNSNHYDDTYLVLKHGEGRKQFYLLPNQRFEDRIKIDWPLPFQENNYGIVMLGHVSINGILCVSQIRKRQFVLWNPTTGEFRIIHYCDCSDELPFPRLPRYALHGFGYDQVTNDYKIIQLVDSYIRDEELQLLEDTSSYEILWMIYSLRSNRWRKLNLNIPNRYVYARVGAYTNGVFHWWARTNDSPNDEDEEEYLMSFKFSNKTMFTTQRPSYLDIRRPVPYKFRDRRLVVINESIALISTILEMATFHISILGELGIRESWTKIFTLTCSPSIKYPIGVGNLTNKVLFSKKGMELAWIDLKTKMMEEVDVKVGSIVKVGRYKKSFLPIGGMNN